jgi:hypothetical protein
VEAEQQTQQQKLQEQLRQQQTQLQTERRQQQQQHTLHEQQLHQQQQRMEQQRLRELQIHEQKMRVPQAEQRQQLSAPQPPPPEASYSDVDSGDSEVDRAIMPQRKPVPAGKFGPPKPENFGLTMRSPIIRQQFRQQRDHPPTTHQPQNKVQAKLSIGSCIPTSWIPTKMPCPQQPTGQGDMHEWEQAELEKLTMLLNSATGSSSSDGSTNSDGDSDDTGGDTSDDTVSDEDDTVRLARIETMIHDLRARRKVSNNRE